MNKLRPTAARGATLVKLKNSLSPRYTLTLKLFFNFCKRVVFVNAYRLITTSM